MIRTIEIRRTYEDRLGIAELALYINSDFCGDLVVPEEELEAFITGITNGFGRLLVYEV